mmetsp:Transcript_22763/g.51336  ORF Transcript_22763/g.51336 Transcript_22763/m.51336 type:complete len:215 (-) Transcript_22763:825-1469(-)
MRKSARPFHNAKACQSTTLTMMAKSIAYSPTSLSTLRSKTARPLDMPPRSFGRVFWSAASRSTGGRPTCSSCSRTRRRLSTYGRSAATRAPWPSIYSSHWRMRACTDGTWPGRPCPRRSSRPSFSSWPGRPSRASFARCASGLLRGASPPPKAPKRGERGSGNPSAAASATLGTRFPWTLVGRTAAVIFRRPRRWPLKSWPLKPLSGARQPTLE